MRDAHRTRRTHGQATGHAENVPFSTIISGWRTRKGSCLRCVQAVSRLAARVRMVRDGIAWTRLALYTHNVGCSSPGRLKINVVWPSMERDSCYNPSERVSSTHVCPPHQHVRNLGCSDQMGSEGWNDPPSQDSHRLSRTTRYES